MLGTGSSRKHDKFVHATCMKDKRDIEGSTDYCKRGKHINHNFDLCLLNLSSLKCAVSYEQGRSRANSIKTLPNAGAF